MAESRRATYARALCIALAKHFKDAELEIDFKRARIEGPQTDRDIGCVWFDSKRPNSRDGNNEDAFFGVRVLRRLRQDQGGDGFNEETEDILLWTFETLEDGLAANLVRPWLEQNSGLDLDGWGDLLSVTNMTVDHQAQHVTAAVTCWSRNRTARGG